MNKLDELTKCLTDVWNGLRQNDIVIGRRRRVYVTGSCGWPIMLNSVATQQPMARKRLQAKDYIKRVRYDTVGSKKKLLDCMKKS